jgi:hypothetical protein
MSFAVVLQALGWVSVVWLVVVHAMVQRGRLPRDGRAYRIAGCAAATSVVAAGVAEEIWPVAVLGVLWLRTEIFGHRHHIPDRRIQAGEAPALGHARAGQARALGQAQAGQARALGRAPGAMPELLVSALGRNANQPPFPLPAQHTPDTEHHSDAEHHPDAGHHLHLPHLPHPHLPHPHLARRTVDRVFKIEMAIVITIAAVLFIFWAEQQRVTFTRNSDKVVCNWIEGC